MFHMKWLSSHCSGSGSAELALQLIKAACSRALGLAMDLRCAYVCVPRSEA